MTLLETGIILIGLALVLTAFIIGKRSGLVWLIPFGYHAIAFYFGVVNEFTPMTFIPIGGFCLVSFFVAVFKLLRGDLL